MGDDSQQGEPIEGPSDSVQPEPIGSGGLLWISLAALVCAVALLLLPRFLTSAVGKLELGVWYTFLGDLHPIIVHMPIGIFILVFTMELCGLLSFGKWKPQTTFPLFLGVVTAIAAVICGNFLHLQGDHPDSKISNHLWGATVFAVIAILTYLSKLWATHSGAKSPAYGILLTVSVGSLTYTAHAGGELVHGDPFAPVVHLITGEKTIADEAKAKAEPAKPPAERLVYKEVIVPILRGKCYECHADADQNPSGKKKIKGKLVMTSIEDMKKGGDEYSAIVSGDIEDSLMIERIKLPHDDDDHMPPEDKPQIESHELQILEWWIKAELPEGKTMKAAGAPAEILKAAEKLKSAAEVVAAQQASKAAAEAKAAEAEAQRRALEGAIAEVSKSFPNALSFVSQQDSDLTFTAVSLRKDFKDEHLGKLAPVSKGLVDLNLGSTSVSDTGVSALKNMPKLRKLWLNGTQVTDGGLDAVGGLGELEYLNLYGTNVTNDGLKKLAGLKNLKKLYLWQTKVTPEAVEEFKKSVPDCEVNLGISVN